MATALAVVGLLVFFAAAIFLVRSDSDIRDPQLRKVDSIANWVVCVLLVVGLALTFVATKNDVAMGIVIAAFACVPLCAVLKYALQRVDLRRSH